MKGNVIGAVIAVAIVVGSTLLVINMVMPTIEEGKDFQSFSEAKKTMELLDATITQVFFEAPGARRSIDIDVKKGKLIVSGPADRIKIRLEDVNLFTPGLRRQEGNILVTSGAQVDAYEGDVDKDGSTDLVLENDGIIFAVRKLGSPSGHVIVNTTNMIVLIHNKRTNTDMFYPKSAIYINDTLETSYGIGYTELADRSSNIASASIHIYVNATLANTTYDGVFTLGPAQDFLEFHVSHVTGGFE
jgi:hypothetical protein